MKVKQVEDAAKRAADIHKAVYDPDPAPGTTDDVSAPAAETDKTVQTPAAADTPTQEDTFQQRYYSLKGKYDAEVPRLHNQVRDLSDSVRDLTNQLTQKPEDPQKPLNGNNVDIDALENYGQEFGELARQFEAEKAENAKLKQTIEKLSEDIGQVKQKQAHSTYDGYLKEVKASLSAVKQNFDTLNTDPAFLTWLQQPDDFSGKPRHETLQAAEVNLDVERTMKVFNTYLNAPPKQKQAEDPKSLPNVQPPARQTGTDLDPPTQKSKRTWSRPQISEFYREKPQGKFQGKMLDPKTAEATFKTLEADLMAAQVEGRIVQ